MDMRKPQESIGNPGLDEVLSRVRLAESLDYDWIGRVVIAASLQPVLEKILANGERRPLQLNVEALLRIKARGLDGVAEVCCLCQREGPDNIVVCRGNCC